MVKLLLQRMRIIQEVSKVAEFKDVKTMSKEAAIVEGLYVTVGAELDDAYMAELKKLVIDPKVIQQEADDFTIVYTPLHGTGNIPVRKILEEIGFTKVLVVPEQELPDGNFPTVSYPNPEDIKAFELAIELGKKENADVILATDPDADRLGVLAKDKSGAYRALNGNMIGILLMDYILSRKKEKGTLPKNGAVIETIVSTKMAIPICAEYDIKLFEVLTGFKYIGEKIKEFEESGEFEYLFGFEESYGCLIGTHARDKDAVVATMGVCELAAYYKSKGLSLYEALVTLYEKYGYYKESLESLTLKGMEGIAKIQSILNTLRQAPPAEVNGVKVMELRDYEVGTVKDFSLNTVKPTGLPTSNVLYFTLEDESWLCIRPSGTEPKVKLYFGVKGASMQEADDKVASFSKAMMAIINQMV